MEIEQESGWKLHPIGGETGKAFMGVRDEEKVFLKKNSSPFLAALSLEGITPRLIWTKRTGNGDVLTAQEWCNGRTLNKDEMDSNDIAKILAKMHQSETLKRLLERVGGEKMTPYKLLVQYKENLTDDLEAHPVLDKAYMYLVNSLPLDITEEDIRVCHADISSANMLLSDQGELYIVDWDTAILMDYLFDIGQLFARYIDRSEWQNWAEENDMPLNQNEKDRINWYAVIHILLDIKYAYRKSRFPELNKLILRLNSWLEDLNLAD